MKSFGIFDVQYSRIRIVWLMRPSLIQSLMKCQQYVPLMPEYSGETPTMISVSLSDSQRGSKYLSADACLRSDPSSALCSILMTFKLSSFPPNEPESPQPSRRQWMVKLRSGSQTKEGQGQHHYLPLKRKSRLFFLNPTLCTQVHSQLRRHKRRPNSHHSEHVTNFLLL